VSKALDPDLYQSKTLSALETGVKIRDSVIMLNDLVILPLCALSRNLNSLLCSQGQLLAGIVALSLSLRFMKSSYELTDLVISLAMFNDMREKPHKLESRGESNYTIQSVGFYTYMYI